MSEDLPAEVGEVIGSYELDGVLGQGGMGSVFSGKHVLLGRPVAVKVLASVLAADQDYVSRFFHEARIVNDISHPNIVDVMDFIAVEEPRRVAYVMEYIEGPSLTKVLREGGLQTRQAINIAIQLAEALASVHSVNVIHRDLKPDNILLIGALDGDMSERPSAKILDFGIAKITKPDVTHQTATGSMLGTPAYMAPEQIAAEPATSKTDIYALGELLYEMVTGERLFEGGNMTIFKAKLSGRPPEVKIDPAVPSHTRIAAVVAACTAPEPTDRLDLDKVLEQLYAMLAEQPAVEAVLPVDLTQTPLPDVPPPPPASPLSTVDSIELRPKAPRAMMAILAAVGVFGLAVGIGWQQHMTSKPHDVVPLAAPAKPVTALDGDSVAAKTAPPVVDPDLPAGEAPFGAVAEVRVASEPAGAQIFDEASGQLIGTAPMLVAVGSTDAKKIVLRLTGYLEKPLAITRGSSDVSVSMDREPSVKRTRARAKKKMRSSTSGVEEESSKKAAVREPPAGPIHKKAIPEW